MGREQSNRGRGRFQSARGGRGGRGHGRRFQAPTPRTQNLNTKPVELKFAPHVHGKGQQATYATVKDAIIQFVQKTFKDGMDVAQSLEDGKAIDLIPDKPKRKISEQTDEQKATLEQEEFDMDFKELMLA